MNFFIYILAKSICNKALVKLTEDCNEPNSLSRFQILSAKKINFKKSLNGKIKITFKSKSSSDYIKLKKCFHVLPEFHEEIIGFKSSFKNDVATGSCSVSFQNGTSCQITLGETGQISGIIKYYDKNEKLTEFHHCQAEYGKWTVKSQG